MSFHGSVALMNHSCSPNVIVTYKGTVAEVRAVQEINPEDEVRQAHIMLVLNIVLYCRMSCHCLTLNSD